MLRAIAAKFRPLSHAGERSSRASILLAFLIVSAALGVLAWRSYKLSVRMEWWANTLAVRYAGYAAETTALRIDAAVRGSLTKAVEDWQQVERWVEAPTRRSLEEWMQDKGWIVSAIYLPDHDPASSIFATEPGVPSTSLMQREFFTSTGTLKYTYDPARLIAEVGGAVSQQQPAIQAPSTDSLGIQPQADVAVVYTPHTRGLVRLADGFTFYAPLQAPMEAYSVRAIVPTSYAGSGWQNQRLISFWVSLAAVGLMALGGFFALRGLNKEAETMNLRSALIANVSHELRTPLSMIRLGAETLQRGGSRLKDREREEIQDQILRETLHLSHLVENVLDVARIQNRSTKALAFTPVMPRDLVTTLVATYGAWVRSKGFSLSLEIDEGVEPQMWDRDAVSRALLNLIDNAIKYSGEDHEIVVGLRQTPAHIILEVRDRGVGIGADDLSRIFDPYYRARFSDTQTRRGAGLGLTLVQQIMNAHSGRVEVESEPGAGSTFRLLFPRAAGEERVALAGVVGQSKPVTS